LSKSTEEYTEEELNQMFLETFFWVAENRPEWLEEAIAEAIARKKQTLAGSPKKECDEI
jgi:hypothetical protein